MTYDRDQAEQFRQQTMHAYREHIRHQPYIPGQPPADPVRVVRTHLPGSPPGRHAFWLCRWSVAQHLAQSAAAEDRPDEITDFGPDALAICSAANRGEFPANGLLLIGVEENGRWLQWSLTSRPIEPVPAEPEEDHANT